MPRYDFACGCGHEFEAVQPMNHEGERTATCGRCGEKAPWKPSIIGFKIAFKDGYDVCTGQYHTSQKQYNNYIREKGLVKLD